MGKKLNITKIKKLEIKKFRGLENLSLDLGEKITVICGKNGTSKSSILGIIAQIFTFRKNYLTDEKIEHKTITGTPFESGPEDHFRLSKQFDTPGSMSLSFDLYDGYTKKNTSAKLQLMTRETSQGILPRPQVRGNTSIAEKQDSRSFTHPVIYVSLNRLMPIALRKEYKEINYEYIESNKQKFKAISNKLLNKNNQEHTSTSGVLPSTVVHGDYYDHQSVSTGEDNAGQIILAIMSFQKLKEEMGDNYKGGVLLIDEADAGLFPAAQLSLIEILKEKSQELFLQIVITTHSPTIIERIFELGESHKSYYKTLYLTDSYGKISLKTDWNWVQIYSDIHLKTIKNNKNIKLPLVNLYFEDLEAYDFYNHLLNLHKVKKFLNPLKDISLGCSNYINLIQKNVSEFSKNSIVILDGDTENTDTLETVVLLPTKLPPDQLIFEFLYNLDAEDEFWNNESGFSRAIFTRIAQDISNRFEIKNESINIKEIIENHKQNYRKKDRDLFKEFYKNEEIQSSIKSRRIKENAWLYYISKNEEIKEEFIKNIKKAHINILTKNYGIDSALATQAWES